MLVVGDESHDRARLPWVTFTLIAVNILVFSAQLRFGERLTLGYALVPLEITEGRDISPANVPLIPGTDGVAMDPDIGSVVTNGRVVQVPHYPGPTPIFLTLLTYQFLHGDIYHIGFNMWFLLIFGRNVESEIGHWRFLRFYLLCGVMAGLAQVGVSIHSPIPIVGASGSIAGVMGAYLAMFPWNRLKVCVGMIIGIPAGVVQVPAFFFVGFWIAVQVSLGWMTDDNPIGGSVAYWAHIGGFLAGFIYAKILWATTGLRRLVTPVAAALQPVDHDPMAAYRRAREQAGLAEFKS